jgi:hypothetical protein
MNQEKSNPDSSAVRGIFQKVGDIYKKYATLIEIFSLLLVELLMYGIFTPNLGFYWDDVGYIFTYLAGGPQSYVPFFAADRPFSAGFYTVLTSILGASPLGYHIWNIVVQWLTSVLVYWMISLIWPRFRRSLIWIPFLFVVYPGFLQKQIPLVYAIHWINLLQTLLSINLMILSWRYHNFWKWIWTALAVLLSLNYFSLEYFWGMELARALIVWFLISSEMPLKARFKQFFIKLLPYVFVPAAFLYWRTFIFRSINYNPSLAAYGENPLDVALKLLHIFVTDYIQAGFYVWIQSLESLLSLETSSLAKILYWEFIGAISIYLLLVFLFPTRLNGSSKEELKAYKQAVILGLVSFFGGGIPVWISGLPIKLSFPNDRLTMPLIFGSSFLMGGLISLCLRTRWQKVLVAVLLISFAAGTQFNFSNAYRREWDTLGTFLRQVSWRAPGLTPGTALVTYKLPLTFYTDNSLFGLVNLLYQKDGKFTDDLKYGIIFTDIRLGGGKFPDTKPDLPILMSSKQYIFKGSTSKIVVFTFAPPSCLRILDPGRPHEYPEMNSELTAVAPLSLPNLILSEPEPLLSGWMPTQSSKDWCYYFEKADLARQQGSWQGVVDLGKEALPLIKQSKDFTEEGVFIEGFFRSGDGKTASQITRELLKQSPESQQFICQTWAYLSAQPDLSESQKQTADLLLKGIHCP